MLLGILMFMVVAMMMVELMRVEEMMMVVGLMRMRERMSVASPECTALRTLRSLVWIEAPAVQTRQVLTNQIKVGPRQFLSSSCFFLRRALICGDTSDC